MRYKFIGTGSAFNHKYGNNSMLLEFNNTNLLLDCGHDVPGRLDTDLQNINNIWISHIHNDHCGGLEEVAFKNYFLYKKKTNLLLHHSFAYDFINHLLFSIGQKGLFSIDEYFNVFIYKNSFTIKDIKFTTEKTNHVLNMDSFLLKWEDCVFTGDTQFIDWRNHENIKHIFQDTQLEKYGEDVHTCLEDLLKLPLEVKQKINCMHYGEAIENYRDVIEKNGMKICTINQWSELY